MRRFRNLVALALVAVSAAACGQIVPLDYPTRMQPKMQGYTDTVQQNYPYPKLNKS